jgi:dipeptidyl-peptidase 4
MTPSSAHRRAPRPTPWTATAVVLFGLAPIALAPLGNHLTAQPPTQPAFQPAPASMMRPDNRVMGANWLQAARFAPYKMSKLTYSTSVNPRWIGGTDRFWYQWDNSDGTVYYVVDPAQGTKRPIFDNDRIAAELTRITRDPWDGQHLPIRNIEFVDESTLRFEVESSQDEEIPDEEAEVGEQQEEEERRAPRRPRTRKKVFYFEYDVNSRTLRELEDWEEPRSHPGWAGISPDSSKVVYNKECNLYMMDWDEYMKIVQARHKKTGEAADSAEAKVEVEETQLTTDGEMHYCYGSYGRGQNDEETEKNWGKRQSAGVLWSHDSRWFAMTLQDRREVGDLWVVHVAGSGRPKLETYKYDMPGEEKVTQTELLVYDTEAREMKKIDDEPWKDQTMGVFSDPTPSGRRFAARSGEDEEPTIRKWMSPNSSELYFFRASRNLHRIDVMVADPATGDVRTVIEERLNTYQEQRPPRRLANGDLIWWSERDGWAHLYRYGADGTMKARLTEGPWHVVGVTEVDEDRGVVFFHANAREPGEDPYYRHLYRVGLDGRGLTLLNPGDFDHRASVSESGRFFVNHYSRVNTVPAIGLHDAGGRKILDLEVADFTALDAAGYQFPEPYRVKSADGITDIYGVMYKPFDFDPEKKYPIVAYVYPGPQTESVAKAWSSSSTEVALAQMGFIVITIGNRGGHPDRSKWYHNYGYGNLRDYGLADKKSGIEQLADRHPFIDVERVGIYGHSGGGFMSTAAMLVYPEFFKVAVSSAGNHDNSMYNRWWSETHHGVKEVTDDEGEVSFEYDILKNQDLARNLKGHLLLTTGDVDNNVHHGGTFRVAEALIRANKRFDFFIFPGQRHGFGNMSDYWFWLRAEYFAKHLLGDYRTAPDIMELNNEREQTGGGTGAARTGR